VVHKFGGNNTPVNSQNKAGSRGTHLQGRHVSRVQPESPPRYAVLNDIRRGKMEAGHWSAFQTGEALGMRTDTTLRPP
jgi:hypothetical protein